MTTADLKKLASRPTTNAATRAALRRELGKQNLFPVKGLPGVSVMSEIEVIPRGVAVVSPFAARREFTIDGLKAVNQVNARVHWSVRARQVRACRERVAMAMLAAAPLPELPVVVSLVRVGRGNRKLDANGLDGLVGSLKSVIDEIACCYGIDDADPRIRFAEPRQERGDYAVRVTITAMPAAPESTAGHKGAAKDARDGF